MLFRKSLHLVNKLPIAGYCSKTKGSKMWPKRIFSGIQPTGVLHLGNYFGAIENWVALQDNNDNLLFSIVDLHSITLPKDPNELHRSILLMTATLLACGIDPSKSILYQQSKVKEHTMLAWVLGTMTTLPRLYHFPQYKEKSATMKEVLLGLFLYPVLQSADILLYKSTHVPVGDDQIQHLHLTQHLVSNFNNKYGETFPFPEYIVKRDSGASRVRSLRDPSKKMSKSDPDVRGRIELTDSADSIVKKLRKAVTDSSPSISYDPEERPGVSNLVALHSLTTGSSPEQICSEYSTCDTSQYKMVVAECLVEKFNPIREEILRLQKAPDYLMQVLEMGNERAEAIACVTWKEVTTKVGFGISADLKDSESLVKKNIIR